MAGLDRAEEHALEFTEHAGEYLQMVMALSDYNVYGMKSLARIEGEGRLRTTIDAAARLVVGYLKGYAFTKQPARSEVSAIATCPIEDVENFLRTRAGGIGLLPEEVDPVCDVVVKSILLNNGRARGVMVPGPDGPRASYIQLAESRIDGIKLTTSMLSALSRIGDIDMLVGGDFNVMNLIIKSKIETGTSDDVVEAFKAANEMIQNQVILLGDLREQVRNREKFESMDLDEFTEKLGAMRKSVSDFVRIDLPARRDQFNNARMNVEDAEAEGVDIDEKPVEAVGRMQAQIAIAFEKLQAYIRAHEALMKDMEIGARLMRSEQDLGFIDFKEVIEGNMRLLDEEGLERLPGLLLSGIVPPEPPGRGLPWIDMFTEFSMPRESSSGVIEYDASPDEEFEERESLNEALKAVCTRARDEFRAFVSKEGRTTLQAFLDSRSEEERAEFFAADAVYPLDCEDDRWVVGNRLDMVCYEVADPNGGSHKVRFEDFELIHKEVCDGLPG